MRTWHQINLNLSSKSNLLIDEVVSLFDAYHSLGSEVKYAFDYYENEENLFGEIPAEIPQSLLQRPCEIISYFKSEDDFSGLLEDLKELLKGQDYELEFKEIKEENWQENWMAYYQPEKLSRFITVLPVWYQNYQTRPLEQIVKLDPGIAFGTGNHPTSRLGAQALEIIMEGGEAVLDVGCGTGILSFVAAVLGASYVQGFDLDPQAVESAQQNLQYQDHPSIKALLQGDNISFQVNDLLKGVEHSVDIIVANILPHILINLFEDASRLLNPRGYLILGGILADKGAFIESHMSAYPFQQVYKIQSGEWLSYIYQKEGLD